MKFLRRITHRYSRIGLRRKSRQKWRRPTGRDNKMREKRRGYPIVVSIGHRKVNPNNKILIRNVKDFSKIGNSTLVEIAKIGKKKKLEIAKMAKEKGIKILNLKIEKILGENKK